MNDLSKIFMGISSEKGNKFANEAILKNKHDKIASFLNKYIEFIAINLTAEFNRISCSPLGQLKTREIGNKLQKIIEEHIQRVIILVERENESIDFIQNYFNSNIAKLYQKISKDSTGKRTLNDLFEMNLLHDFGKIVDHVCNFNIEQVDLILRYLVFLNILRRISRRDFIPK